MPSVLEPSAVSKIRGADDILSLGVFRGEQFPVVVQRTRYNEAADLSGVEITAHAVLGVAKVDRNDNISDFTPGEGEPVAVRAAALRSMDGTFQVLVDADLISSDPEYGAREVPGADIVVRHRDANSVDVREMHILIAGRPGTAVDTPDAATFPDPARTAVDFIWESEATSTAASVPAPSPLPRTSGYYFHDRRDIAPDAVAGPAAVPTSGDGYRYEILPGTVIEGAIEAANDFVAEFEGNLLYTPSVNGIVEIDLLTTHDINGKQFTHRRVVEQAAAVNGVQNLFRLSNMNSRSQVRVGTVTVGGVTVEITEADLAGPTTIDYSLEFFIRERRGGTRKAGALSSISVQQGEVTSFQLQRATVGSVEGGDDNVQSDWTEGDTTSDAFIRNKPDLSGIGTDETARGAAAAADAKAVAAQATADAALPKAGGTMTGKLTLDGAPTSDLHAATKKYVDDNAGGGGDENVQSDWNETDSSDDAFIKNKPTIPAPYTLPAAAPGTRGGVEAVTNDIIDTGTSTKIFGWAISHVKRIVNSIALPLTGGTMTGKLTLDGAPTSDLHAATKKYVDDNAPEGDGSGTPTLLAIPLQAWKSDGSNADQSTGLLIDRTVPRLAPERGYGASYGTTGGDRLDVSLGFYRNAYGGAATGWRIYVTNLATGDRHVFNGNLSATSLAQRCSASVVLTDAQLNSISVADILVSLSLVNEAGEGDGVNVPVVQG